MIELTWNNVFERVEKIREALEREWYRQDQPIIGPIKIWGIPRGGSIVSGFILAPTSSVWTTTGQEDHYVEIVRLPQQADFAIDDIIDSGDTKQRIWNDFGIKTYSLVDKITENIDDWVKFPWEGEETIREHPIPTFDRKIEVAYVERECPFCKETCYHLHTKFLETKNLEDMTCTSCSARWWPVGDNFATMATPRFPPKPKQVIVSGPRLQSMIEQLAEKKGISVDEAEQMIEDMMKAKENVQ